jgi:hypothetical protein
MTGRGFAAAMPVLAVGSRSLAHALEGTGKGRL